MAGKKKTGRTKQLSLKAAPKFHQRLKELAVKEKCLMIEVLEEALELYEQAKKEKRLRKRVIKEIATPKTSPTTNKKRFREDDIEETSTSSKKRKIDD